VSGCHPGGVQGGGGSRPAPSRQPSGRQAEAATSISKCSACRNSQFRRPTCSASLEQTAEMFRAKITAAQSGRRSGLGPSERLPGEAWTCHALPCAVGASDDVGDHRDDAEPEQPEGKQRPEPRLVFELQRVEQRRDPGGQRCDGPAQDRQRPDNDKPQRGPRA
jgi:hypothetical protein